MSCGGSSGGCGGSSSRSSSGGCGGSASGGCGSSSSSGGCGSSAASSSGGCGGSSGGNCPNPCGGNQRCPPIPPPPQAPKAASSSYKSKFEKKILCSKCPIDVSETATICANGVRGIYVNKCEADKFSGPIPLSQYKIFNDPNPKIINKTASGGSQTQEVSVKFLQPPAPGPAGDIIIREKAGTAPGPAPPIIIRQQGKGGGAGKPQCFRECPPPPCPKICPKVIEVCAPAGNPPPRRVIIEKLPGGASAPGPIFAERWLAASGCVTRNVRYEKAPSQGPAENPRNVIIQWQQGPASVKVVTKSLGKSQEDPCAYYKKHGSKLVSADDLPESVKKVKAPSGTKLAACGSSCPVPKLTGCVKALKKVDLSAHGLSEYQDQVDRA